MPGFSVARGDTATVGESVAAALDATVAFDHYDTRRRLASERVVVGETTYDGYPVHSVETDHGTAFLEGYLYDVEDVDAHLERVASLIAADDVAGLAKWVGARDGDFLVLLTDGATVTLLNDAFGRLPVYLGSVDGATVCSRELAFVREFARQRGEPLALDRLAVGQFLAFGYPLGTRTLFEAVQSVPPGSLVRLGSGGSADAKSDAAVGDTRTDPTVDDVEIESLYEHDFDDCAHADRSVETNADELTGRIETACRRRMDPERQTVLSLSGGLDSRTVAAAYARGNDRWDDVVSSGSTPGDAQSSPKGERATAIAATFQHAGDRNAEEVAAAGAVASELDLDWSVYTVESSPDRRETLLRTKQGMNYLGMAFVLDFFEQLRDRYGTTTYATGDGGDKLLVGLEPSKSLDSTATLVDHTIEANARMSLEEAAAIANVDSDAIRASVAERFDAYPESDRERAYVHFLIRERGLNMLVQGEDRNRYYAWTVTPFYALPVFEYAMNCPDEQKAYRRLQSEILERFDSGLVDLPYPNYGAPISTRRYRAKQFVYDALERYPSVRERVVDLVTTDTADRIPATRAIRAELPQLTGAGLSADAATEVLEATESYSGIQLENLATVAALARGVVDDAVAGNRAPTDRPGGGPTERAGSARAVDPDDGAPPAPQSVRADR